MGTRFLARRRSEGHIAVALRWPPSPIYLSRSSVHTKATTLAIFCERERHCFVFKTSSIFFDIDWTEGIRGCPVDTDNDSYVNIWRECRKLGRRCLFRKFIKDIRYRKKTMLILDVRLSQRSCWKKQPQSVVWRVVSIFKLLAYYIRTIGHPCSLFISATCFGSLCVVFRNDILHKKIHGHGTVNINLV